MISIVLYGRNDSYGYNLHKRAALALNCMAEVLTDPADEILFVDYNTPDDFPTFPEAIADTLTPRAADRLRILRVRPPVHARVKDATHLVAVEPIARNVAVRRSNPENRWILSTNTDMIFVPRTPASLSEVAATLDAGYYHLPRFEIPESVWEGFDRRDPAAVIGRVEELGRTMFLNEIVYGAEPIKYDAPGDFQLILRDDLFRIHGFDERMLLGWHVDSNIAKRLFLIYGRVGDVVDRIFGYHCDHTRQVTPAHRHRAPSNDARMFVDGITRPELPEQAATWGCASDEIEEVRLVDSAHRRYVQALTKTLTGEMSTPVTSAYDPSTYDTVGYDPRHVLPFLADVCATAPRAWSAGWVGGRTDMFQLFCAMWHRSGFTGPLMIHNSCAPLLVTGQDGTVVRLADSQALSAVDILFIDFGAPSSSRDTQVPPASRRMLDDAYDRLVRRIFAALVRFERLRQARGNPGTRVVCINAIHNGYETMVLEDIAAAATPFATRLRHGFVTPRSDSYADDGIWADAMAEAPNLLDAVEVGEGGTRTDGAIRAPAGRRGVMLHGPHRVLPAGVYSLGLSVESRGVRALASLARPIIVDVLAGASRLVRRRVRAFGRTRVSVTFEVTDEAARAPVYCRIFRGRSVDLLITELRLTRIAACDDDRLEQLVSDLAGVSQEAVPR